MCSAAGTTESGGGEREGGDAEEELRGEGEDDSQPAREPARTADCAATAGWCLQTQNSSLKNSLKDS